MRGALLVLLILAAACAAPAAGPTLLIDTASGIARVRVEIADTPDGRERGLMGRTALAEDAGMLFEWTDDTSSAFWMKDTLIPLSIAFVSADGRVLALLDMEPCRADPCPVYDPHVVYRMALEAKQGAFARWGVHVGDRARLVR